MDTGWIKLYRCSVGSRVFNNEGLLKVWIWCLLKANHSTQWVNLKTGRGSIEVECKDGQFIFGRNSAAKELNMDGNTVWKRMQKLKNMENLNIESNKQYSIISIMNWHTYQTIEKESNSKGNKQVTSKQHASNTNKNVKNVNNEKKVKTSLSKDFFISDRVKRWSTEKGHTNLEDHLENFILKCNAKQYKYVDWDSAFMGAIRDNWAKVEQPKDVFTVTGSNGEIVEFNTLEEVKAHKALLAKVGSERLGPS